MYGNRTPFTAKQSPDLLRFLFGSGAGYPPFAELAALRLKHQLWGGN